MRRTDHTPTPEALRLEPHDPVAFADVAVEDVARRLAGLMFGSGTVVRHGSAPAAPDGSVPDRPAPDPHPGPEAEPEPIGALARLRALALLRQAVEERADLEARTAALAGAGYPQLGASWGISRQGARRRWPGLAPGARTASPVPATSTIRRTAVHALVPSRPYNVLLIEDDPADALLVEEALIERQMTRTVHRVEDGVAALEYLRDTTNPRPDLIVLDLNMPRMSGRELLTILKDDEDLSVIPVVVLTTSGAPNDIHNAYAQHANAYVTKPVNLDDFIASVHSIDAFFLDTAQPLPIDE